MNAMVLAATILRNGEDHNILLTDRQIRRINKRMRKMTNGQFVVRHANYIWWLETVG